MSDITFYTNPMSRGRIARWMLEETGAPYRTEVLDYGPAMKTPAYRALNPMGKVPTVVHGEVVVTGDRFAIRLSDVVSPTERMKKLR